MKKTSSLSINKIVSKTAQNVAKKMSGNRSFLYNKYLLYISFVVAFINILLWISSGDYFHVIVFILVGYLTYQFSKNMMVVLVIAFVISNIVKSGSSIVLEGMEEKKKTEGMEEEGEKKKTEGMEEDGMKKEGMNMKQGMKNKKATMNMKEGVKNKQGMKNNDSYESYEGLEDEEESQEGMGVDTPCMTDLDCAKGDVCDKSRMVCSTKKK